MVYKIKKTVQKTKNKDFVWCDEYKGAFFSSLSLENCLGAFFMGFFVKKVRKTWKKNVFLARNFLLINAGDAIYVK